MPTKYNWSKEKAFRVDEDGCLIWRGQQHSKGFPLLYMGDRRTILVRRAILALMKGRPLKPTEKAIVTCGKALCCAPQCLRAVSPSRIGKIAIAKHDWTKEHARRMKISATRKRRWTEAELADMRARHAAGERPTDIAAAYGTKLQNLSAIWRYKSNTLHLPPAVRYALVANR